MSAGKTWERPDRFFKRTSGLQQGRPFSRNSFLGALLTPTFLIAASSGCTKKFPAWLLDRDGGPPPDADLDAEVQPDAGDGEVPGCGDGAIDTGETCDDSNTADNDGCSAACQVEAGWSCVGEPDGDTNDRDGCRGDCSRFDDVCGDGILECGEICDGTNLDGFDCTDFWPPYDWGTLQCDPVTCTFDLSTCYGGDDCTTAGVISDSTTLAHSTDQLNDTYNGNGCGELVWNTDGRDRAYRIELEAGEYMVAWLYPTNWRASIYLTTDCNDIPNSCPEGWRRANVDYGTETLHYATNTADTVYLIVDGSGGGERGDYVLDITIGTFAIPQNVGDVIITEAMRDPDNVGDDDGEWFEIYNTTSADLLLAGMVVDDDTGEPPFTIDHPLIIFAGDYLVFGRNARWDQNGLVYNISWVYPGTYRLWNNPGVSGDRIGLNLGATLLDEVVWYDNWPGPAGYSMELCLNTYDDVLNDDINNWHDAPQEWDPGNSDYGSPGVDNNDVGSCP